MRRIVPPSCSQTRSLSFRSFPLVVGLVLSVGQLAPLGRADEPERESMGLSSALGLPQDRQLEQFLDAAEAEMSRQDYITVTRYLEQIITHDASAFVADETSTVLRPAQIVASRRLSELPAEVRTRVEAVLEDRAVRAWNAFREHGNQGELPPITLYTPTMAGLRVAQWRAASRRDEGRHAQAAMAWQAVIQHRLATDNQRCLAVLAAVDSLIRAGLWDHAERLARSEFTDRNVVIGGRSVAARDWLRDRLLERPVEPVRSVSRPAFQPVWSRPVNSMPELDQSVQQIQQYYHEQGVVSSSQLRPVVAGPVVLYRTMQDLQAVDLGTGEPRWSVPNQEYAWMQKRTTLLENSPFRTATAAAWHRRLEADSLFAGIAVHRDLAVVVQEPDRSNLDFAMSGGTSRGAQPVTSGRWNKLCGYELADGQLRWQIGGPMTGPADVLGGLSFLGAPLFLDEQILIVARRDEVLKLLALDAATGHLLWAVELGILPAHLVEAVSRRRIACPVMVCEDVVLCATAAGTLVAVDPNTRSIRWVSRYPMIQHESPVRTGPAGAAAVIPDLWWDEWREVACHVARVRGGDSPTIVLATPDCGSLLALDGTTGTRMWSAPRGAGLHLAGVTDAVAVVTENAAVSAFDLRTGERQWRYDTGEVAGRGTIQGNLLIQPLRAGGTVVVDLATGRREPTWEAEVFQGNLVPCDGGWISQVAGGVHRFPRLDDVQRQWADRWERDPSESVAIELARLELQSGHPGSARQRLSGYSSADAKTLQRRSLLALLRTAEFEPQALPQLERELRDACQNEEELAVGLRLLGDAAQHVGDAALALRHYRDGLTLVDSLGTRTVGDWPVDEMATWRARADRVLLGRIEQTLADPRFQAHAAQDWAQLLESQLSEARDSSDPFAVQRVLDRQMPLESTQAAVLNHLEAVAYARSLQKLEPLLLQVAGSREPHRAALALEFLANQERQAGWPHYAEILERRVRLQHPGMRLARGQSPAATWPLDFATVPQEPWPSRMPVVTTESRRRQDVYYVPVRIASSPDNLLERLEVSVDRQGRKVRFVSEGHSGSWELQLPGVPRLLRAQFANLDQIEAHGVGRRLILRVGSEVFGILPFNERGEPVAALTSLQFDMAPRSSELPNEAWWYQEPVPGKPGVRPDGLRLVDGLGRPFGGLGPVRPGYLCYRSQSRLVAVETATGRLLWERPGMPVHCQVLGDDSHVLVWQTDSGVIQVLSATDGRTLREFPFTPTPDDVLLQEAGRIWSCQKSGGLVVRQHDLTTGAVTWSQVFPDDSLAFALDPSTLGVLDRRGLLHLISTDSGAPLGEPITLEVPERIERIVVQYDAQRWYVAISEPVPRLVTLQSEQPWGGSRVAFVQGWLYGIDRTTPGIVWRRYLNSEPVPQHASPLAPVLVQLWRKSAPDMPLNPGHVGEGILKILDKRTGRELASHRDGNLQAYHVLVPVSDRELLDVCTEQVTIHLNYGDASPESTTEGTR